MTKKVIYYVCNRTNKVEHCLEHCFHGKPHLADQCTTNEVCKIDSKKGVVVKCCPATKQELADYAKEQAELNKKRPISPWG